MLRGQLRYEWLVWRFENSIKQALRVSGDFRWGSPLFSPEKGFPQEADGTKWISVGIRSKRLKNEIRCDRIVSSEGKGKKRPDKVVTGLTESEFQEFIITMGYRYHEKTKTAFNTFEGFHNIILFGEQEGRYTLRLSCGASGGDTAAVWEELKGFQSEHKESVARVNFKHRQITVEMKMTIASDIDKEELKALVHFMTVLCKSEKLVPLCRVCGRQRKTGVYVVGREMMPICDACVSRKRRLYEKRRDLFEKKQQNMAAGLLGAVFGAALGALLNVLLYQIFPIRSVWSILIAVLTFAGFVVTGRRATKKSGVICTVIAMVFYALSEYAAMVWETAVFIEREGGGIAVSEAVGIINSGLADHTYLLALLTELAIGFVLIVLTGVGYFLKRKYTRPMKISKNLL